MIRVVFKNDLGMVYVGHTWKYNIWKNALRATDLEYYLNNNARLLWLYRLYV